MYTSSPDTLYIQTRTQIIIVYITWKITSFFKRTSFVKKIKIFLFSNYFIHENVAYIKLKMVNIYAKIIGKHYIITAEKCGIQLDHLNQGMFALDWKWRFSRVKSKCFRSLKPTHCKKSATICLCQVTVCRRCSRRKWRTDISWASFYILDGF